ncbi:MAG: YgiT-type zinc finger protein [candidate division NC10 bacterium]|nr:YgiT-type zinc finger protein [candidate division NC10 bacterium]MDE2321645.1 YgiT-type zinc finger protein [candidate division NC10 bacterium]
MKCIYCQGEMKVGAAPFHVDRKGYHLLLDAMPAYVCFQCGEAYFESSTVDLIQEAIRRLDDQTARLAKSA